MITIDNVTKTYRQGSSTIRALDGLSLEIERGEILAIIGPSGSGKSTLMNMIGLLDRPTSRRDLDRRALGREPSGGGQGSAPAHEHRLRVSSSFC